MRRSANLQRLLILGLSGPIVALNVWVLTQLFQFFQGLITILVTAAILAFLLNYPVRLFQRAKFSRAQAVTLVLFITVTLMVITGITIVPIITEQTAQLFSKIPGWLQASADNIKTLDGWAKARNLPLDLMGFSDRINNQIEGLLQSLPKQALDLAILTFSGLIASTLVLVLAFYMLLYGNQLWNGLINLFPPQYGFPFRDSLELNFHNFIVSQILLAVFMGVALIPVFLALQVPFALLFAVLIAIAEVIPLVGPTLGIGLVAILLMLQNPWLAIQVTISATILQQVRDNVLAPKLLGDITGLNPIWIFIALLMGLQIGGFLGIIVAVPIAGTIKGTLEAVRKSHVKTKEPAAIEE
ncbi:MAG: AI-2E family transporter [Oscillatoriales cyanobacterium C42_A2020_001]|nr:AI-2E family transporter [Leptolyngbyaceae cyanobacterium C42_A2020_001]